LNLTDSKRSALKRQSANPEGGAWTEFLGKNGGDALNLTDSKRSALKRQSANPEGGAWMEKRR